MVFFKKYACLQSLKIQIPMYAQSLKIDFARNQVNDGSNLKIPNFSMTEFRTFQTLCSSSKAELRISQTSKKTPNSELQTLFNPTLARAISYIYRHVHLLLFVLPQCKQTAVIICLGGHISNPEFGRKSLGCVRQHVRPQQFETRSKSKETGPHRR